MAPSTKESTVTYVLQDAAGKGPNPDRASGGSVKVTEFGVKEGMTTHGTYHLTFGQTELAGAFDAPFCQRHW